MQWTKQNEQTVYANRWFDVNLADVELPDGRQIILVVFTRGQAQDLKLVPEVARNVLEITYP